MTENFSEYTAPGLDLEEGRRVGEVLQLRLHALNDLHLTLKHAHWNVVGPDFIAVHEMLDPQVEEVRGWADLVAERMATLGVSPQGTPGKLVTDRTWEDYQVGRADTLTHISALNEVYTGVIADFRNALAESAKVDPITEDILTEVTRGLELFQWFLRSFITKANGELDPKN